MHQVVEFTPEAWFKPFGDAVSNVRRAGAIIADTMKLVRFCFIFPSKGRKSLFSYTHRFYKIYIFLIQVGNSGYGKTTTNQLKQKNLEHCSDAKASRKVNTPLFRKL